MRHSVFNELLVAADDEDVFIVVVITFVARVGPAVS